MRPGLLYRLEWKTVAAAQRLDGPHAVHVAEYLASLGRYGRYDTPLHETCDPMDHQHDGRMSPHPRKRLVAENDLVDKVEWGGQADATALHLAACERLLVIDGIVHYRSEGPVWQVSCHRQLPVWLQMEKPRAPHDRSYPDTFRADRLEDAMEFGRSFFLKDRPKAWGEILDLDPSYMTRNHLAHGIDNRLATNAENAFVRREYGAVRAISLFSAEALSSWKRLVLDLDGQRPFSIEGFADPIATLDQIEIVLAELDERSRELADWEAIREIRSFLQEAKPFTAWVQSRGWPELAGPGSSMPQPALPPWSRGI